MSGLPLPGQGRAVVVVPGPGRGPWYWAGASCAARHPEGGLAIAYRLRNGHDGTAAALEDKTLDVQAAGGEGVTFVISDQDV